MRAGHVHVRRKNGTPLDDKSLHKIVWTATFRLAGIRMNPHLVRDSIVTFARHCCALLCLRACVSSSCFTRHAGGYAHQQRVMHVTQGRGRGV